MQFTRTGVIQLHYKFGQPILANGGLYMKRMASNRHVQPIKCKDRTPIAEKLQ